MPCYHPIKGQYAKDRNPDTGKRSIVFSGDGFYDRPIAVPCGKCIGCRLDRSRQWAVRCVHEAQLYDDNCFITLTFRDSSPLPGCRDLTGSLFKPDFQSFIKRLRDRISRIAYATCWKEGGRLKVVVKKKPFGVRYFHCGEYGEVCKVCGKARRQPTMLDFCTCPVFVPSIGRPHHHACLFNFDFPDKYLFQEKNGVRLYRSEMLESLWPYGYCTIGDVTFKSAAYVARYVTKKILGTNDKALSLARERYGSFEKEYCTMSRRPGVGDGWFRKYVSDLFPKGYVVLRGKKMKIPKFYMEKFKLTDPKEFANVVGKRVQDARGNENFKPERLEDAEVIVKQKFNRLVRPLEVDDV